MAQPDPLKVPRYANLATFARLPAAGPEASVEVGVVGIPFDGGCSYRPGARFGPSAIRQASRLLRGYNPEQGVSPFEVGRVADLGDLPCTPFDNRRAVEEMHRQVAALLPRVRRMPVFLGGDHTISYPILKALSEHHGGRPLTLLHFDSHMDTWDDYFGEGFTHGTPFRRAFDEGVLDMSTSMHIGLRGSVQSPDDLEQDRALGFRTIRCAEVDEIGGPAGVVRRIGERLKASQDASQKAPPLLCYISIDIDVVDPSAAPGTGTPGEAITEVLAIAEAGLPR